MCFSLAWLAQFLVWLVVICGAIALIRLLIGFVMPRIGVGGEIIGFVAQALYIVIWVLVCIAAIYFIFDLIACLGPSLSMPRLH